MSQNLETEYKRHIDEEVSGIDADALWNRIESALPEKETKKAETPLTNDNQIIDASKHRIRYKNKGLTTFVGTAAAAVIVLFLVIPNMPAGRNKDMGAAATNTDIIETTTETVAEEIDYGGDLQVSEECSNNSHKTSSDIVADASEISEVTETEVKEVTYFIVTGKTDEGYTCISEAANSIMNANSEFTIITDEEFTVGDSYSGVLSVVDKDNMCFFVKK